MKLEMRSTSRVYGRPVSLTFRRDENIGNNVAQCEASDEILSPRRYSDFSPSLRTQSRARFIHVTTRTRRTKRECQRESANFLAIFSTTMKPKISKPKL